MKRTILAALMLSGCAQTQQTVDRLMTRSPDAERTRRYNLCMKQTMGPFSGFSAPEARRKAAETCQTVLKPAEPLE